MRKRGAMATEQLARDYMSVFGTDAGQRVLTDLAEFAGFFKVTPPGTDADRLQYVEGGRNVIGRILHYLGPSPEQFHKLQRLAAAEARVTSMQGDYMTFDTIDAMELQ
jgi:hypothetical protein